MPEQSQNEETNTNDTNQGTDNSQDTANNTKPAEEEPDSSSDSAETSNSTTSDSGSSVSGTKSQMFTVKIPDAANDTVNVEIVADGQVIHNAVHSKTEGAVTVEVQGSGSVSVQAYIDGAKVSDKTITFN